MVQDKEDEELMEEQDPQRAMLEMIRDIKKDTGKLNKLEEEVTALKTNLVDKVAKLEEKMEDLMIEQSNANNTWAARHDTL